MIRSPNPKYTHPVPAELRDGMLITYHGSTIWLITQLSNSDCCMLALGSDLKQYWSVYSLKGAIGAGQLKILQSHKLLKLLYGIA